MDKYCDEVNKKIGGQGRESRLITGGTLLSATKMAAGVATGIADIGLSHCSYSRGRFPVTEIMELPLGFPSGWMASHVIERFLREVQAEGMGHLPSHHVHDEPAQRDPNGEQAREEPGRA